MVGDVIPWDTTLNHGLSLGEVALGGEVETVTRTGRADEPGGEDSPS